jgi:hypothetical protein
MFRLAATATKGDAAIQMVNVISMAIGKSIFGQPRFGAMTRHRSMRKKELKKKPGIAENNIRYPNIAASL